MSSDQAGRGRRPGAGGCSGSQPTRLVQRHGSLHRTTPIGTAQTEVPTAGCRLCRDGGSRRHELTEFHPGDEVFGGQSGAFAEYVAVHIGVGLKPVHLSFEEAAAVPMAGITALQGCVTKGRLQPGQHVLVNGASGGVGTFAVQIAKALGAEVTAVCSSGNVEMVRSIGADHVVDYTVEDFTRGETRYDIILDIAGTKPWSHEASAHAARNGRGRRGASEPGDRPARPCCQGHAGRRAESSRCVLHRGHQSVRHGRPPTTSRSPGP